MVDIPINYEVLDRLPSNAGHFFKVMSRFEFALKENGFTTLYEHNVAGKFQVDIDRFANTIANDFFDRIATIRIAQTIINEPPRHQRISEDGSLEFIEAGLPANNQDLFNAISRIRNNLFHGGKFGELNQDRNTVLIREAISIIEQALGEHEDMRLSFEG